MPEPTVRAYGLKALRQDIRKLGTPDQMKELKAANAAVAGLVVAAAKARASTRMQRRAADTLKVAKSVYASVRLGGIPGALGTEFGAHHDMPRRGPSGRTFLGYNQFEAWRGTGEGAGYFLWPAIRENTAAILELYAAEMMRRFGGDGPAQREQDTFTSANSDAAKSITDLI